MMTNDTIQLPQGRSETSTGSQEGGTNRGDVTKRIFVKALSKIGVDGTLCGKVPHISLLVDESNPFV